jgi:hypothetical protein
VDVDHTSDNEAQAVTKKEPKEDTSAEVEQLKKLF